MRLAVATVAAVLAQMLGLLTWQVVTFGISGTALAMASVAIVVAGKAYDRTNQFQDAQAERITVLEADED